MPRLLGVARQHFPGNPALIPVNMPGGGGITAANYMGQIAPRDGTVIGIVSQGGAPLVGALDAGADQATAGQGGHQGRPDDRPEGA